jgi:tetratricopeptide (TPR) repeat protein
MIYFLTTPGYDFTLRAIRNDPTAPSVSTLCYDQALEASKLRRATYVFTDIDRLNVKHRIDAARLFRRLQENGCRVLNDPAYVRTRFGLLRGLFRAGLNPIDAYLVDEDSKPNRFPVFVRVADGHDGPLSDLIWDQGELDRTIEAAVAAGFPRSTILIVEYSAEPIRPGLYRKASVYRVGDHFFPDINWHASSWLVKGDQFPIVDKELYIEELDALSSNHCPRTIEQAFQFAKIDFGRLDFGMVQGRPVVYEINTNPTFFGQRSHPVPERVEGVKIKWGRLLAALRAIDSDIDSPPETVEVAGLSVDTWQAAKAMPSALRLPYLDLSKEYERRGNLDGALHCAHAAVEANPGSSRAFSHLCHVLKTQGRIDEAIVAAKRAVDLKARNSKARRRLAALLIEAGNYEEARQQLLKALESKGDDGNTYQLLSCVCRKLGDNVAAINAESKANQLARMKRISEGQHTTTLSWMRRQWRRLGARPVRFQ